LAQFSSRWNLSKSTWLVTALSPFSEKMCRYTITGGDIAGLFVLWRASPEGQTSKDRTLPAGSDPGGRVEWLLVRASTERGSLDREPYSRGSIDRRAAPASPAKTDRIDCETLIRALMAWKRGEPHACSMVKLLTPEEDDNRRIGRERKTLIAERVYHVDRIKGLLFTQGIREYEPVNRDRRQRLDELRTGDGRPLSKHLNAEIWRELDRLELLLTQIKAVQAERDALIVRATSGTPMAYSDTSTFWRTGTRRAVKPDQPSLSLFRASDVRKPLCLWLHSFPCGRIEKMQSITWET
jgi:transposase